MSKPKRVFVTGATGFLGQFLTQALTVRGHEVVGVGSKAVDLTRAGSLANHTPLKGVAFDEIFHLAAWTQAGDFCLTHQGEQWLINQRMNTEVLGWWKEHQPQAKLITMGTSCSYDPELPLSEPYYLKGEPIKDLFVYAMTKRMLYAGQRAFTQQFGLKHLCVVPSTLYGPGYHTDGRQMHFIFDLIRKILNGKRKGEPVSLWGDGHQRRELVFVGDFVRILLELNDSKENEIYNIGAGHEHTIREFATLICNEVGYDFSKIHFDTSKYVGAKSKCLDVTKIKSELGDLKLTPLSQGLKETIRWFEKAFP